MGAAAAPAPQPLTPRGKRTRARIIAAARSEFEKQGFAKARISEIATAADTSYGTFYTYFGSKHDVLRAVTEETVAEMISHGSTRTGKTDPVERIKEATRQYLLIYQRHAKLLAMLDPLASEAPQIQSLALDLRSVFVDRNHRALLRLQESGLADRNIDARYAASCLGSMVERSAFVWFVLGEPFDLEDGIESLTIIWSRAIGLGMSEHPEWSVQRARS